MPAPDDERVPRERGVCARFVFGFASARDRDIRVYTDRMKVVKVRRVGNSNVVSIPRELEARGFAPGTSVLVEELETGELRIIPTEQVRARIRDVGQRLVGEHVEALKILAEHDPPAAPPSVRTPVDPEGAEPVYLDFADALELYAAIVGGTTGQAADQLRDRTGLESALGRPRNYALYEDADLALQAAALLTGSRRAKRSLMATSASR